MEISKVKICDRGLYIILAPADSDLKVLQAEAYKRELSVQDLIREDIEDSIADLITFCSNSRTIA